MNNNKPKIGLALGSGGARGLAHIGILKVLEKHDIKIDYIAGSSIGAIIGGFYASGSDVERIEKFALGANRRSIFSLIDLKLKCGLIGGKKIEELIDAKLKVKEFENCKIPFSAVATDLKTGEVVLFDKGDLTSAIRASISIPLVFKPMELDGRILADGGLSEPVPVKTVREMGADIVIAVNLDGYICSENWTSRWFVIADNSFSILRHHLALSGTRSADIVIDVGLGQDYWYEFINGRDKIEAGERVMEENIIRLQELIEKGVEEK